MSSEERIRVHYRIETPHDPRAVAEKIASDQSTRTFTELPGVTAELKGRCAARVASVAPLENAAIPAWPSDAPGPYRRADIAIDYPLDAVGADFAALQTITVGGVFAVRGLSGVRVLDFELPDAYRVHPGPRHGIAGSRRLTGVERGPIIGSIIKPALGLTPNETAEVVRTLCRAGVDFIKDDEKLMSPAYSPFDDRVDVSIGPGALAFLRKRSELCLHAHRNGWDVLTRHPALGMEFTAWHKIWRLLGIDQFQVNGIRAKYWEPDESFLTSFQACSTPLFDDRDRVLPVVSSGQWGGQAPDTYRGTGGSLDLMYLGGGGIHGHPMGPAAGVTAIREAWKAAESGRALDEQAQGSKELAAARRQFGQ